MCILLFDCTDSLLYAVRFYACAYVPASVVHVVHVRETCNVRKEDVERVVRRRVARYSSGSFWTLCSVAYSFVSLLTTSKLSRNAALIFTNGSHFSGNASSGKIASTGHSGSQAPQSMHSSRSITRIRSASWIQSTGQTSTHERSLMSMHGSAMT